MIHGTKTRYMPPLLVTLVAHPPSSPLPALPEIVPQIDYVQSSQLNFLPFAEWEKGDEYDEYPPRYVCYTIAWKPVLNRKTVGKVTEDDLIVTPSEYWDGTLKANVEDMLQMKEKA